MLSERVWYKMPFRCCTWTPHLENLRSKLQEKLCSLSSVLQHIDAIRHRRAITSDIDQIPWNIHITCCFAWTLHIYCGLKLIQESLKFNPIVMEFKDGGLLVTFPNVGIKCLHNSKVYLGSQFEGVTVLCAREAIVKRPRHLLYCFCQHEAESNEC